MPAPLPRGRKLMGSVAYTTGEFKEELARVRRARRRNAIVMIAVGAIIVIAVVAVLMGLVAR